MSLELTTWPIFEQFIDSQPLFPYSSLVSPGPPSEGWQSSFQDPQTLFPQRDQNVNSPFELSPGQGAPSQGYFPPQNPAGYFYTIQTNASQYPPRGNQTSTIQGLARMELQAPSTPYQDPQRQTQSTSSNHTYRSCNPPTLDRCMWCAPYTTAWC
jgi:hypothetical protein